MQKEKVLFVCWGNTCRSPMSEAIAEHYYSESYIFDSAGFQVSSNRISEYAEQALQELLNISKENHKPKNVNTVNLEEIDTIYILDDYVYSMLTARHPEFSRNRKI